MIRLFSVQILNHIGLIHSQNNRIICTDPFFIWLWIGQFVHYVFFFFQFSPLKVYGISTNTIFFMQYYILLRTTTLTITIYIWQMFYITDVLNIASTKKISGHCFTKTTIYKWIKQLIEIFIELVRLSVKLAIINSPLLIFLFSIISVYITGLTYTSNFGIIKLLFS